MTAAERREHLLEWWCHDLAGVPLTAAEAGVRVLMLDPSLVNGPQRAREDLEALARQGHVERLPGRPARWQVRR